MRMTTADGNMKQQSPGHDTTGSIAERTDGHAQAPKRLQRPKNWEAACDRPGKPARICSPRSGLLPATGQQRRRERTEGGSSRGMQWIERLAVLTLVSRLRVRHDDGSTRRGRSLCMGNRVCASSVWICARRRLRVDSGGSVLACATVSKCLGPNSFDRGRHHTSGDKEGWRVLQTAGRSRSWVLLKRVQSCLPSR